MYEQLVDSVLTCIKPMASEFSNLVKSVNNMRYVAGYAPDQYQSLDWTTYFRPSVFHCDIHNIHNSGFILSVCETVWICFCVFCLFFCQFLDCLDVNSGALVKAHYEGRRISFVKSSILGCFLVLYVSIAYICLGVDRRQMLDSFFLNLTSS
jgi:hypothetical protein